MAVEEKRMDEKRLLVHTAQVPQGFSPAPEAPPKARIRIKRSFQEQLLRNSCVACAALLGILALGNLNTPWARRASEHIEQALTMEIDLDQSLGQLRFVQKLMPESALVFFNLSGESEMCMPVRGEVQHPFSDAQPWLMLACGQGATVCAPADGVVAAVSRLNDGSWGVLIDHGDGLESVSACLEEVSVGSGDQVLRGSEIGAAQESLYFELRQDGEAVDPSEKLGL